mgnify:FL=1
MQAGGAADAVFLPAIVALAPVAVLDSITPPTLKRLQVGSIGDAHSSESAITGRSIAANIRRRKEDELLVFLEAA